MQARAARPTGLPRRGRFQLRLERRHRAVGDLVGHLQRAGHAFGAEKVPGDLQWVAVGRVEREPGPVDVHVHVLDLQGDPVDDRRDLVRAFIIGRDRDRGGFLVDFELRSYYYLPEVVGAGLRWVHDAQPERGALVRAGDVHLAAPDGVGVPADTHTDDRFPDQAFRATRPFIGLLFAAQLHARQRPGDTLRHVQRDALQGLFAVFAAHRHLERAEPARLDARRTHRQGRVERQWVAARAAVRATRHVERGARVHRPGFRPRFHRRRRRVRPTLRRGRQRRSVSTEEVQFEGFKRQLGGVLECGNQLPRDRVRDDFPGDLYAGARDGVFDEHDISRRGSRTGWRPAQPGMLRLPAHWA